MPPRRQPAPASKSKSNGKSNVKAKAKVTFADEDSLCALDCAHAVEPIRCSVEDIENVVRDYAQETGESEALLIETPEYSTTEGMVWPRVHLNVLTRVFDVAYANGPRPGINDKSPPIVLAKKEKEAIEAHAKKVAEENAAFKADMDARAALYAAAAERDRMAKVVANVTAERESVAKTVRELLESRDVLTPPLLTERCNPAITHHDAETVRNFVSVFAC